MGAAAGGPTARDGAEVSLAYVGVGCNRVVNCLHWGDNGLVAYGAHHAVVVFDPQARTDLHAMTTHAARVVGTLLGHTDVATCLRWFSGADLGLPSLHAAASAPSLLASGGGDGDVRLWLWAPAAGGAQQHWAEVAVLKGHTAPVTSLTTLRAPLAGGAGEGPLLVSTAGDGAVLVWQAACPPAVEALAAAGGAAWQLRQRIGLGHGLQHCAALARLPLDPGWTVLALGGVDQVVRLLLCPPGGGFAEAAALRGHQDWVRGLAFSRAPGRKLLLASASQDRTVRLWALEPASPAAAAAAAADEVRRYEPRTQLRAGSGQDASTYAVRLESLLIGHEDWVQSVAWRPGSSDSEHEGGAEAEQEAPCLLSASMDRTMLLWSADPASGLWLSSGAVGDAGANHLGYYTAAWGPGGSAILTHGFTAALHLWSRTAAGWEPRHAMSGHYGPVVDACWAADGQCLLTVSTDQTARLVATVPGQEGGWCEIARPQVHGHDFSCAAALRGPRQPAAQRSSAQEAGSGPAGGGGGGGGQRYVYASGSEEKVIRVFESPRAFEDTLAMARGEPRPARDPAACGAGTSGALGATLPALGLSNRAVYEGEGGGAGRAGASAKCSGGGDYTDGPDLAPSAAPSAVEGAPCGGALHGGPPLEEHLAQNTLWPEARKLYGHGSELYRLAADPAGAYLASSCRASSAAGAAPWLWDARRWAPLGPLPAAHSLTVTALAFSPCGRWLASGSRDRALALYERLEEGAGPGGAAEGPATSGAAPAPPFRLAGVLPKAHARLLWGLAWSPDSRLLATASRDGTLKLWRVGDRGLPAAPAAAVSLGGAATSVAFAPGSTSAATRETGGAAGGSEGGQYHVAVGLESGAIRILRVTGHGEEEPASSPAVVEAWASSAGTQHAAAVRALCWRRAPTGGGSCWELASAGDDHSVRIFAVRLPG